MKILILDAYFKPETTAFTHLEQDLIEALVNEGHEIVIICPTPTRGIDKKTAKKYSGIKEEQLYDGKVFVKRFWAPQEKKGFINRAFRYFWCNHRFYHIAKNVKGVDLIFSNSTPPVLGLVNRKLKNKLHVPFVYSLQDIFPDSLVKAGMTKKGSLLWRVGRKIENKTYAAADKIIVISEDFKRNILAKIVPEEKISVIYNWVDTETIKPIDKKDNKLFDELGLDIEDYIVLYAGNFGKAQGVKVIIDAANLLKDNKKIRFVLFGGGAEYEEIKGYAKSLNLSNVIINPLLPIDRISEVYSMGSVNIITCKKGFGHCSFPSKTWSIMACNSYIIASYDLDSELASVIKTSGVGQVVEPDNAKSLADAILNFDACDNYVDGRAWLLKNADKKFCVNQYVDILEQCGQQQ